MLEYSREGNVAAKACFEQAIELDPKFGRAYAAIANVIFHDIVDGYVDSRRESLHAASDMAIKAISLDAQDAFAHFVSGRIYTIQGRFEEAVDELETAIELNPSLAQAYHGLAYALYYRGDAKRAIPLFETAQRLSPYDHNVWAFLGIRAQAYIELRDYDSAIKVAREAIRKPNAKYWADVSLVSALSHANENEEARAALDELLQRKPDLNARFIQDTLGFTKHTAQLEHFIDGLRRAGLPDD